MVVVIAIVVIVAAIAIPQALKAINKSKATTDYANARTYAGQIMNKVANGEDVKKSEKTPVEGAVKSKLLKYGEFTYILQDDNIKIFIGDKEIYPTIDSEWAKYISEKETQAPEPPAEDNK